MVLAQKITAGTIFLAENVNGLEKRTFICIASKTDARIWNNDGNSIIENMGEEAVDQ